MLDQQKLHPNFPDLNDVAIREQGCLGAYCFDTATPIVAGTARMHYPRFALYNFTGAILWAIGVPVAGYALGSVIPPEVLDRWLYVIIAVVIGLSVLPTAIHLYRHNRDEVHARIRSRGRQGAARPPLTPDEAAD